MGILSFLWIGVLPLLVMHRATSPLICYEPASSCLLHVVLPGSGIRGQSLAVALLNTPSDFTHLGQGL